MSPWRRLACRTKCRDRQLRARPSSLSMVHCASRGRKCSVESWRRSACRTQCRVLARLASAASSGALFPPCPHIRHGLEIRRLPGPDSEAWPPPSRQAGHASPSLARLWRSTGSATTCKGGIRQEALQVPQPAGLQACQVTVLFTTPADALHRRHALRGDGMEGDPRMDPKPERGDADPDPSLRPMAHAAMTETPFRFRAQMRIRNGCASSAASPSTHTDRRPAPGNGTSRNFTDRDDGFGHA